MFQNIRNVTDGGTALQELVMHSPFWYIRLIPVRLLFYSIVILRSGGNRFFILQVDGTKATCYCCCLLTMADETRGASWPEQSQSESPSQEGRIRVSRLISQVKAWHSWSWEVGREGLGMLFQSTNGEISSTGRRRITLKQKAAENRI